MPRSSSSAAEPAESSRVLLQREKDEQIKPLLLSQDSSAHSEITQESQTSIKANRKTQQSIPPPPPSEWLRLRPGKSLIVLISARQMIVFPLHLFDCFYFNLKWHVRYILICRAVLWRLLHCNINEVISPPTGLQIWRLTVADCVKIYFFFFFPAIVISRSSCKQSVIISDGKPRAAVWVITWYLLQKVNWSCWSVQRKDWFDEKHFRCFLEMHFWWSELLVTDHSSKCLPEKEGPLSVKRPA